MAEAGAKIGSLKDYLVREHLLTGDEVTKNFMGRDKDAMRPRMVVRPADVEQVQKVVEWARAERVALVPVSSGAPHLRGVMQMSEGACVVDLSGMKRIVSLNRRNRVALFEAGVTFEELIPVVRHAGLRPMLPLCPRPGKSALAAYLDREPTIIPKYQWDLADPLLCLELVFGTGDIFRTGSAAGPGTIQEQWLAGEHQKNPMGPGQNDWMRIVQGAQGSIGIATWCSAKTEVWPKAERLFAVSGSALGPLIEAGYRMFHRKLTDVHFILDRSALNNLLGYEPTKKEKRKAKKKNWWLIYSVSGIAHFPEERAKYFEDEAKKELKAQGLKLAELPGCENEDFLKQLYKVSAEPYWKDRPWGAHRSVYFQTTMDKAEGFVELFTKLAEEADIAQERISAYLQPQLGGRCCHLEFIVAADAASAGSLAAAQKFCDSAAAPLIKAGAFFSRPHGAWSGPAMNAGNSAFWVYEKTKDIFDPDHILAPGRLMLGGDAHARA